MHVFNTTLNDTFCGYKLSLYSFIANMHGPQRDIKHDLNIFSNEKMGKY